MHLTRIFTGALLSALATVVSGLGTSCSAPLGAGTAAATDPFWMQNIAHQGTSAYNANPATYQVFRNVKDFGAKGDGVTDDTAAINAAITAGSRCGGGSCASSTLTPAVIFFPSGTYVVSAPIIAYYYSQLIGDARNPPTLLATAGFVGIAVIDADPYIPGADGAQFYVNQNNFFRSVRNFVIDLRQIPATTSGTGFHWQASQSTSLMNIVVQMSTASDTAHQGIFMENGSGGFLGDLVFNGGKFGMWVGNQQFTVRNVTVNNAQSGIFSVWNWGWTYQGVTINNCQVGFDVSTGGIPSGTQTSGSLAIIDATINNTPIFVRTSVASGGTLDGSLVINNAKLTNVPVAVGVESTGQTVLAGGTTTIASWGQGHVFHGTSTTGTFTQGSVVAASKPASLLDSSGKIFGRTHPQYAAYSTSQFVSVKSNGAKGDGVTDDTAAITAIFNKFAGCKIIFFDAGTYIVSSTITIPAGTQMVGEAWSVIAGKGAAFENVNVPTPVVRVGAPGSQGIMEITDIVFTTVGPAPGAVVVEWNVQQPSGQTGATGMWDSHIRLGGAAGTNLEPSTCPKGGSGGTTNCFAAYLALHLTAQSTAYLEGTWVWLADHDLDGDGSTQVQIYSGRGILSESAGPVWLIGTGAEHHVLYQYNLHNAQNHYIGFAQTETPYFQPSPAPPAPFSNNATLGDPATSSSMQAAWALNIQGSSNIIIFGAGFYSFFQAFGQACLTSNNCQPQIVNIDTTSTVTFYSLNTVASTFQLSIGQQGVINQSANSNGFAATITAWSRT
ncbi:glycoside hydrolase family 55 protein [Hypholoma sublateritium FD-334 SS-4]|uniref:Glycoside hydrolase family 55 protein n=1 Tax=Hypholoma sublateritium (strain FD-334 SS-4) TaxID=945553 RepID=A0A0D2MST4_HYPSF|nr:glycoside hydrolase family 55 protein [Hypholoma sublateritium FD-334 SS-4]